MSEIVKCGDCRWGAPYDIQTMAEVSTGEISETHVECRNTRAVTAFGDDKLKRNMYGKFIVNKDFWCSEGEPTDE